MWSFRNPFQWVLDLPKMSIDGRLGVFGLIVLWFAFVHFVIVCKDDIFKK
jgi:hypothetical protein